MKQILESTDTTLLISRATLLRARGIPTHMDEVAHVGVVPQHLYILHDEQFDDALALLEDESHEVSNPIWPEDEEPGSTPPAAPLDSDDARTVPALIGLFVALAAVLLVLALL